MLGEKRRKNEVSPSGGHLPKQDASPHTVREPPPHLLCETSVGEYVYHTTFRKIHTELLTAAASGEQKPWQREAGPHRPPLRPAEMPTPPKRVCVRVCACKGTTTLIRISTGVFD